jgi:chromosome segregation ATPase
VATDSFARLEDCVSRLIQALDELRIENQQLKERARKSEETQRQSELDKQNLDSTIGSLKGDSRERERMLHTAADKLQELVTKLESAG